MGKGNVKIGSKDGTNVTIVDVFFETINRKRAYH